MNDEQTKKHIEEEGHEANADMGELDTLEPATGAAENEGFSEGEDMVDDIDGIARENTTPDAPEAEGDR